MTGIGVVVAFLTFATIAIYYANKKHLDIMKFVYRLPQMIICLYLLGSYGFLFIHEAMIIPLSINDVRKLLFPFYEYRFHLVGLLVGMVISVSIFFKSLKTTQDKAQWIDILFLAMTASFIPLGFFLLLGDDYIGKTNEGLLSITALHPESKVAKFASVYPVGIMITIVSTILHIVGLIIIKLSKKPGKGRYLLAALCIALFWITLYQQYPMHVVFAVGGITFDIKHHVLILTAIACFIKGSKYNKKLTS